MGLETGFLGGGEEGVTAGAIVVLELAEGEVGLGVAVLEGNGGQGGTEVLFKLLEVGEESARLLGQREVELGGVSFFEAKVVDEAAAVAGGYGEDFVLAVGEEGGVVKGVRVVRSLGLAEVDGEFLVVVANEKFAAFVG